MKRRVFTVTERSVQWMLCARDDSGLHSWTLSEVVQSHAAALLHLVALRIFPGLLEGSQCISGGRGSHGARLWGHKSSVKPLGQHCQRCSIFTRRAALKRPSFGEVSNCGWVAVWISDCDKLSTPWLLEMQNGPIGYELIALASLQWCTTEQCPDKVHKAIP